MIAVDFASMPDITTAIMDGLRRSCEIMLWPSPLIHPGS